MLTASNKDQASSANKAPMRHRIMAVEYDARVNTLNVVIQDDWQELDKQLWANNQRLVKEQLLNDFGVSNGDQKLADFIALGIMPFSVIVSHNSILHQVRDAFTAGTYYPALVSAVSLGERILNQILLGLRDDFKDNDKTKLIRGKNTTDNWPRAIEIIKAWGVFDDDLAKDYLALYKLRVAAVHYLNPGLDNDSREEALDAIILLQKIVERRFSAISQKDLTLPIPGETVFKLGAESDPFIKKFVLPSCVHVSPYHEIVRGNNGQFGVKDAPRNTSLTDEEWVKARLAYTHKNGARQAVG